MSNRQVMDATLTIGGERWEGPQFPDGIDELNQASDMAGLNGQRMESIGRDIEKFWAILRLSTSDGYCWFWALQFRVRQGVIIVAFPWAQDWGQADGTQRDRSIAVYTSGTPSTESITDILHQLTQKLSQPAEEAKKETGA